MDENRRSTAARIGLVALNLLMPGLAFLRLGYWRGAVAWAALPVLVLGLLYCFARFGPEPTFFPYAMFVGFMVIVAIIYYLASITLTWRWSRASPSHSAWWMRWYAMLGLWFAAIVASQLLVSIVHGYYRPFYGTAESMAPTVARNDRLLAAMHERMGSIHRGAVVLVAVRGQIRIMRLIGLPGDRLSMRNGILEINGKSATQRLDRVVSYESFDGPESARRIEERLPGMADSYFILDSGYYPELDEMSDLVVPAGRIFVMGDNRDRAADSRVPPYRNGIGLPAITDIVGRPLFLYWSPDRARIGLSLK